MIKKYSLFFSVFLAVFQLKAQQNSVVLEATLDTDKNELLIQQETVFYNTSDSVLHQVYFHNWPNSFSDRKTPLNKRFIEGFEKDLYFAKPKDLGFTEIQSIKIDTEKTPFIEVKNQVDILKIQLKKALFPSDSVRISSVYRVKIPNAKFTGYGKTNLGFHLRYWHLIPAIFDGKWHLMSNLDMDDLYQSPTNYMIKINVPNEYIIKSNLEVKNIEKNTFQLTGNNRKSVILNIEKTLKTKEYDTKYVVIKSDLFDEDFDPYLAKIILERELFFLEKHLGKYPHKTILLDKITQEKNPIYGLNQLPKFLRPFSDEFKMDLTLFKALTEKYIENTFFFNKRKDYWLIDGIQTYLMMNYIQEKYPDSKLFGKISSIWGVRSFNLAKLSFNDKYPFVYQFSARQFLDQSLTTSRDSLSNFNRQIVNKYKAGLGLRYLDGYLGDSVLTESIKEFYQQNNQKISNSKKFRDIIASKTTKNISWFFGEYVKTTKKIDYTISKITHEKDSLKITIKNNRNITAPVALYGVKDKKIKFKTWVTKVDRTKNITIKKGDFDRISLNYENLYPEYNTLNNWKPIDKRILNKPLKFTLIKDIEDPYYNQIYYEPNTQYNYYDGLILGMKIHNKPLISRNLEFKLIPSYATKSNSVVGSFSVLYKQYFEDTNIYRIRYGIAGSSSHYAPNLPYKTLTPFVGISFKRKSLRDTGNKFLFAKMVHINKEIAPTLIKNEEDEYSILSLDYGYSRSDALQEFGYNFSTEFANNFSKIAFNLRYRKLTTNNTQLDFRFFAGTFLRNKTTNDYFSFGLDRSSDYLFKLQYYGRSETSGIFSQQFIANEGGFKSVLPTRFANQYMVSVNSSVGLWKWIEVYNDVAILKNKHQNVFLGYENGVRLNFVNNILEFYFPIYSNNGWEISHPQYSEKIRFTFTANINAIYDFVKRGFF